MSESVGIIKYNPDFLKSILLLTLAVSGNFIGETLGCKTQFHMSNNMFVKHAILLFIIYFTLNYVSEENEYPLVSMKHAVTIWISYLIFTKQNITFTTISALMIMSTYILDSFVQYYKTKLEKDEEMADEEKEAILERKIQLRKYRDYAFNGALGTIAVGFLIYAKEKHTEYGDKFSWPAFILGKVQCDSLK